MRLLAPSLIALTVALSASCGRPAIGVPGAASVGRPWMDIRVELDHAPALYEPAKVTVTITTTERFNGPVEAWLELPPSAAFINGQMVWKGNLAEKETHKFNATIAFVAEGVSTVAAQARFLPPQPATGVGIVGWATDLRVTEAKGELRPIYRSGSGEASYLPIEGSPLDGTTLLNPSDSPRLLIVQAREGLEELRRQSLVPTEPWGAWQGKLNNIAGVLDREDNFFKEKGIIAALYDRQRPTTGYHLAILRIWTGFDARQMLGQKVLFRKGEEPPQGPEPVVLDIVATTPRPDWAVENRPVSPYEVRFLPYPSKWGAIEVVLRVNGEIVGRHLVQRDQAASPLREIELPLFQEAAPR